MTVNITSQQRDLLAGYTKEAYSLYTEIEAANENIKDIVDAAAEATGLDKTVVKKHFATQYKDDLEKQEELVAKLRFLKGDE